MSETIYEPIEENLNQPVIKGDLINLVTKSDLEIFRQDMNEKISSLPTTEDFSQLINSVDKLTGQVKTYNEERNIESARLERLENWAKEVSKTVNVKFEL